MKLFGGLLDTLGPLKMSISSRRNHDFHLFGLSETRSKNISRKSHKNVRFLIDLGILFERFFLKKDSKNQVQKKFGKKTPKSKLFHFLGSGRRCLLAGGREKERGFEVGPSE